MKKKFAIVAVVIIGLIAAFLAYVSLQPDEFRLARIISVNAAAEKVFPHINDVHKSRVWSPWDKYDPNMKITFEGPSSGVGAKYSWEGNDKVGTGNSTIIESVPNKSVKMNLAFIKPYESVSTSEIVLSPQGDSTQVEWSMYGNQQFMEKVFCTLMGFNMDKMVGPDFETGLKNLKQVVESGK